MHPGNRSHVRVDRAQALLNFGHKSVSVLEMTRHFVYPQDGELTYYQTADKGSLMLGELAVRKPFSSVWWNPYINFSQALMLAQVKELITDVSFETNVAGALNPVTRSMVSRRWSAQGPLKTHREALCCAIVDASLAEVLLPSD